MTNFTVFITVNIFLFGAAVAALNSYYSALTNRYPPDIIKLVAWRYPFWSLLLLILIILGTNVAFLLPNIPPFPILQENVARSISLTLTGVNIILVVLVILFKSPWGYSKSDARYVARIIERKVKGGEAPDRLLLLVKLANHRYAARDLDEWKDCLLSIENVIGVLVRKREEKLKSQLGTLKHQKTIDIERIEQVINEALDRLEKFTDHVTSSDYVIPEINLMGKIVEEAQSHGSEELSVRVVTQLIDLCILGADRHWPAVDQYHVQGTGLITLSKLCQVALLKGRSNIASAVIDKLSGKIEAIENPESPTFKDTCLNAVFFGSLVWEFSLQAAKPMIAEEAVDLIKRVGYQGLQQGDLGLTAVVIKRLQILAEKNIDLTGLERVAFLSPILKALISIFINSGPKQRALISHEIAYAYRRIGIMYGSLAEIDDFLIEHQVNDVPQSLLEIVKELGTKHLGVNSDRSSDLRALTGTENDNYDGS